MALNIFKKREKLPLPIIPLKRRELFLKRQETKETETRFIYLQDYEKIMQNTQKIRENLTQAENTIKNLEKLKSLHEREIKSLLKILEHTERKISCAEEIISKGESA